MLDRRQPVASRTVVLLGLTSLLTDISSEMVVTVLPLYLVAVGGFSPLAFGVIDGIYNGAAAIVRLASAFVGDHWNRHKEVAATGWISAACKLALAIVGTAVSDRCRRPARSRRQGDPHGAPRRHDLPVHATRTRHRVRGAPCDGHHRSDAGPLLAFALLALAPLAFNSIFLVSFSGGSRPRRARAVRRRPRLGRRPRAPEDAPSLRRALSLLRLARFRAVLFVAGALSLATASDAFIFLALQEELDLGNSLFPLLFVGSAGTYMVLAAPPGRVADRLGQRGVLAGYAIAVYGALLLPLGGVVVLAATLELLGAYYAATDGVLAGARAPWCPPTCAEAVSLCWSTATSPAAWWLRWPSGRCGHSGASRWRSRASASRSRLRRCSRAHALAGGRAVRCLAGGGSRSSRYSS